MILVVTAEEPGSVSRLLSVLICSKNLDGNSKLCLYISYLNNFLLLVYCACFLFYGEAID